MKKLLVIPVIVCAFLLTGCSWELTQYDDNVGSCELSDNVTKISIYEYVDSDKVKVKKTNEKFNELCAKLKGETK